MLFNSELFIFVFLPLTLLGFFGIAYFNRRRAAITWLVLMSCVFYAWFRVDYLLLLVALVFFNYLFGVMFSNINKGGRKYPALLFLGIAVNLGTLVYFKYTNFLILNINYALNTNYLLQTVVLPLGISFFIFQKIAYLVDAYRGEAEEYNFLDFCLFVMYFPQLIAGPIVHHKDLIPQFRNQSIFKFNATDMSVGIFMFSVGLCKKILIADRLAQMIDPTFIAAQQAYNFSFIEAWMAALGFTLQIYFDFSAYSDMALGISMMMGIRLPLNFNSPYKATNIIDFWRRWHMTLSQFLRDYVYIPLGGNRRGNIRRYINLSITMIIGGFWHGAAWTFVFWGALHGIYLVINHFWHYIKQKYRIGLQSSGWFRLGGAKLLTFVAVVVSWVFFRAESFSSALTILKGMVGLNGIALPMRYEARYGIFGTFLKKFGLVFSDSAAAYYPGSRQLVFLIAMLGVIWVLPNTQQICAAFNPALQAIKTTRLKQYWRYIPFIQVRDNQLQLVLSPVLGVLLAAAVLGAVFWQTLRTAPIQNFIYFQF